LHHCAITPDPVIAERRPSPEGYSSFIERSRRQSVFGSVFEVVPEISSLMRFGPPRRNNVTLISFTISVDHVNRIPRLYEMYLRLFRCEALVLGCGPKQPLLEAAFWVVRACRVDVEIDDIDAALRLVMAISGVPRPIAQANVADLGEPEATPLTSGRQTLAALAAKLIGQRFLPPL
jgi:hypothetical protein